MYTRAAGAAGAAGRIAVHQMVSGARGVEIDPIKAKDFRSTTCDVRVHVCVLEGGLGVRRRIGV